MDRIDLNTATRDELTSLPLIGPALADRIIAERDRLGRFERLEDLLQIRGVTDRIVESLRGSAGVSHGGDAPDGGSGEGADENPPVRPGKQHGGNPVLIHEAFIEHHLAGETPATPEAYERAREQFQRLPGATRKPSAPGPDDTPEE